MSMSIMIAVGNPDMASILRNHLEANGFHVLEDEVLHRDFLNESIQLERPSILLLHDEYLPSAKSDSSEKDRELVEMIDNWRVTYEDMRVVFLCERDKKDPLLGDLAARNVFDIFHTREIPTKLLIGQLSAPPRYANVQKFGVNTLDIQYLEEEEQEQEETSDSLKDESSSKQRRSGREKETGSKVERPITINFPKIQMPKVQIQVQPVMQEQKQQLILHRKIILVISPFERMGSTFIAHQLAYQLAKRKLPVQYFENPYRLPYTYDRLAGHHHSETYTSGYTDISVSDGDNQNWIVDGVSICALNPTYENPLTESEMSTNRFLRLLLAVPDAPYIVIDVGADSFKQSYKELIDIAHNILFVMEPDLPKIEYFSQKASEPSFKWLHDVLSLDKTELVINRYSDGAEAFFPGRSFYSFPSLQDGWVLNTLMSGRLAFTQREARNLVDETFKPILKEVVPNADERGSSTKWRFPKLKFSVDKN